MTSPSMDERKAVWRQWLCRHECSIRKLHRRADDDVECPCEKCGKVLIAPCGLMLKARLVA